MNGGVSVMDELMRKCTVGPNPEWLRNPCRQKILELMAMGETRESIAKSVQMGWRTVERHVRRMLDASGFRSGPQLVHQACLAGLLKGVPPSPQIELHVRQMQVVRGIADGLLFREVGDAVGITTSSVGSHVTNVAKQFEGAKGSTRIVFVATRQAMGGIPLAVLRCCVCGLWKAAPWTVTPGWVRRLGWRCEQAPVMWCPGCRRE